ncbi:hypothetical protein PMAYCL1PPCAC_22705, partial [Pristionchus mayeri]
TESSIHLRIDGGREPTHFARTADQIASYTSSSIGIFRAFCSVRSYSFKNLLMAGKSFTALNVFIVVCLACLNCSSLLSRALVISHNCCST